MAEVLIHLDGGVGRVRLNRPGAINALMTAMCEAILAALEGWRGDLEVGPVVFDNAEERGF